MEINSKDYNSHLCLGEQDTKNIRKLEDEVLKKVEKYTPIEVELSSIISYQNLRKCGSLISMPQNITVIGNIREEKQGQVSNENIVDNEDLAFSNLFLSPACCLNLYPMLEGMHCENMVVTFRNKAFRYEKGDFSEETRFLEFSNREIVVIGNEKYVLSTLEEMKQDLKEVFKSICPTIQLREGTDAFFPTLNNMRMKKIQYINKLKYEFVAMIDGQNVAMASVNYHNTHFSKPFNFDRNGYVKTGCIGVGLERWAKFMRTL